MFRISNNCKREKQANVQKLQNFQKISKAVVEK